MMCLCTWLCIMPFYHSPFETVTVMVCCAEADVSPRLVMLMPSAVGSKDSGMSSMATAVTF